MYPRPPRLAAWILRLLSPRRQRDEVLGDLEENYTVQVEHFGRREAGRWYWAQAWTTPTWLWREEIETMIGTTLNEARYAARGFIRTPGFTAITVLTLALGMGATTAIFSVVDGVLIEPLPFPEAQELVSIRHDAPGLDLVGMPSATGLHVFYSQASRSFDALALYDARTGTLTGSGAPERIAIGHATPTLFDVLDAQPAFGRLFTEQEGIPGGPQVTIISDGLWAERFGRSPDVVGRTLELGGTTVEIVGVMPRDFAFPNPDVRMWTPLRVDPAGTDFGGFNFPAIGRLRDGVTPQDAQADLNALMPRLTELFPILFTPEMLANSGIAADVHPYVDDLVGEVRPVLLVLLATVGFVLLIACANVANLLLVRAEGRSKEVAIRSALGAGRDHFFARYLTESFMVAIGGAVLGVLVARGGLGILLQRGPQNLPRLDQIGVDGSVLAFAAALTVLAALIFSAIPALRNRSVSVADVIRDGTRGGTATRRGIQVRSLLVASQVAFALMLLVGSGLTLRSFWAVQGVDPGFDASDVLTFELPLPPAGYQDEEGRARFHTELLERIEAIPGVEVAGAVSHLPLWGFGGLDPLLVEGAPIDPDEIPPIVEMRAATPGYFEALDIPLTAGRMLDGTDVEARTGAVLVSQSIVDAFFEGANPLERQVAQGIPLDHDPWSRIVGVVGDVHNAALTDDPMGAIYYPLVQGEGVSRTYLSQSMGYTVRTSVQPTSVVSAIREQLGQMDPTIPMANVRTMEDRTRDARAPMAFTMLMLAIAAGVGLLLGAIGLYGVVSYVTAQRTREIGVRLALGAESGSVRAMIVRQGMMVTLAGLLLGLVGAYALSRFMGALLFQVDADDPVTFAAVAVVLLLVSLAATWIPAMRAAGTDPVRALRWG
jgi:predicted permease